ncbi:single-stranded DNA-binding protein 3 [Trichonephila clavipes]|nr:single-stranded DNA-binding protein 3 [Trichonephila clavipes]
MDYNNWIVWIHQYRVIHKDLYKSLIRSVLTYASETCPLALRDEEALGSFERKILRCILGGIQVNGSWRRKSNLELYKICKQPDITPPFQLTSHMTPVIAYVTSVRGEAQLLRVHKPYDSLKWWVSLIITVLLHLESPPGGVPGQPMIPNSMDPTRQGDGGEFVGWQGPPGMNPMNPRMNAPRGQPLPMNPGNYGGMRPPPNSTMGPGGPSMPPMSMPGGPGGRPWQPNTSTMNYSSASPGSHYGGPPVSSTGPPGPGTPIMPSPQDSTSSGGESMYAMMKPVPGGSIPGFPMGPGPDGPIGSMGPEMGPPVMNGMSSAGDTLDGMKNSPANGPGTPREEGPSMGDYGIPGYGQENDQNESAAILKIKESMQEEAKRFEKDTPTEHPDYFMQ